jgi:hypothetical protein
MFQAARRRTSQLVAAMSRTDSASGQPAGGLESAEYV